MSGDAHHITAPSEDGEGGYRAMQAALKRAGLQPSDVDYVNAHGTSTMADWIEAKAVERLMGDHAPKVALSSTKSMIGHLLGAAGAVECVYCVLAIRDQIAPPTINLENPEQETALNMVKDKGEPMRIDVAMSNSFGFGGTNATVVFRKVD
jgi:3-oxoacyl-[acyl-carrier-protein] synthase II